MSYSDPGVQAERREVIEEVARLVMDSEEKTNEGFRDREVLEDLRARIADLLLETPAWWTPREFKDALEPMRGGSRFFAYPKHCDGCGQEPGTGVRLHGCDVCAEFNHLNDDHAAEALDTGEATQDLSPALYSSTNAKTSRPGMLARRGITRVEEGGAYKR